MTLEKSFDEGNVLSQKKLPIHPTDFPDDLRTKLFTLGADLLVELLPVMLNNKISTHQKSMQNKEKLSREAFPYARRLSRQDGFIPFELIEKALKGNDTSTIQQFNNFTIIKVALEHSEDKQIDLPILIERAFRAFTPWPGIWTTLNIKGEQKRLKILDVSINSSDQTLKIETVQLEGKTPVSWEQFKKAYL